MDLHRWLRNPTVERGIFVLGLGLALLMFILFAMQLPIEDARLAFDWKMLWGAMQNGHLRLGAPGIVNPPWSVIFVMPLGFLSLRASWGVMMFILLASLLASVPTNAPKLMRLLATLLLVTSYPSLRNFADANFEPISVAGTLLTLYSYRQKRPYLLALGVLLATIKPQSTFLLMVVLGVYIVQTMPLRFILQAGAPVLAIVVASLVWKGHEWWGSITPLDPVGISLPARLYDLGAPPISVWGAQIIVAAITLIIAWKGSRELSPNQAGMALAASLLVSPYANGHALIILMATSLTPLFLEKPLLGGALFLLYDAGFLSLRRGGFVDTPMFYYLSAVLLVTWLIFAYYAAREKTTRGQPDDTTASLSTAGSNGA